MGCVLWNINYTFTGTGYDAWKELDGEIIILWPACGLSLSLVSLTLVPDVILVFFLGGAAAVAVGLVLGFNEWHFQFLTSGIVFDGNMSAILGSISVYCWNQKRTDWSYLFVSDYNIIAVQVWWVTIASTIRNSDCKGLIFCIGINSITVGLISGGSLSFSRCFHIMGYDKSTTRQVILIEFLSSDGFCKPYTSSGMGWA